MTSRKIVAVFDSRQAAERARDSLLQLGLSHEHISISDQGTSERTVRTPEAHGGFWAHVKEMFMPDSDRHVIEESVRQGGCVLVAAVDDDRVDEAVSQLESAGAIDLEERESQWRATGARETAGTSSLGSQTTAPRASDMTGSSVAGEAIDARDMAATRSRETQTTSSLDTQTTGARAMEATRTGETSARDTLATGSRAGETRDVEDGATIPVVEERLRVGKREVNRGSVRVRSYIVEEPVREQVRLREERVQVERRPINEAAKPVVKGSPGDLMQERTVEVTETAEQAVVGKEARVTEEVVVSKTANERVEQIDDSVRRTKVEIEDGRTDGRNADSRSARERTAPPPK